VGYQVPGTDGNNGLVATSYQVVISHKRAAGGGQQGIITVFKKLATDHHMQVFFPRWQTNIL